MLALELPGVSGVWLMKPGEIRDSLNGAEGTLGYTVSETMQGRFI